MKKYSFSLLIFTIILFGLCVNLPKVWAFEAPNKKIIDLPTAKQASYKAVIDYAEEPPANTSRRFTIQPLVKLPGQPKTKETVQASLLQYLATRLELLGGLNLNNYRVRYSAEIPANKYHPGMVYVELIQLVEGVEVEGSYVRIVIKILKDRSIIISSQVNIYPQITLAPKQTKSRAILQQQAARALGILSKTSKVIGEKKSIRFVKGKWRRVTEIQFKEIQHYTAVIDEDTRERFIKDNRIYGSGTVKGRGVFFDPATTLPNLDTFDLSDLEIIIGGTVFPGLTYSDSNGNFSFEAVDSPTTVTARLKGLHVNVHSETSQDLVFSSALLPGQDYIDIVFNSIGTDEHDTAQVNAYYHTTYVHDWLKSRLPGNFSAIDIPLPAIVNYPAEGCNAFYDPDVRTMVFFSSGHDEYLGQLYPCINAAYDTIIYHEYGHFLDDMAGGIPETLSGASLGEGWGDLITAFVSGQPLMAEHSSALYHVVPGFGRTADNDYQYSRNDAYYDTHVLGQAWSGFGWHLKENLMATLGTVEGKRVVENLLMSVIVANSPDIPSALHDTILLDDDDGDVSNGTPHLREIEEAAIIRHSIPLGDQPRETKTTISDGTNVVNRTFQSLSEPVLNATSGRLTITMRAIDDVGIKGYTIHRQYKMAPISAWSSWEHWDGDSNLWAAETNYILPAGDWDQYKTDFATNLDEGYAEYRFDAHVYDTTGNWNNAVWSIRVVPLRPDLTIQAHSWPTSVTKGALANFVFSTKNIGTASTVNSFTDRLFVDGMEANQIRRPPLEASRNNTTGLGWATTNATCGSHTAYVVTDAAGSGPNGEVLESNENNNRTPALPQVHTFTVNCSSPSTTPKPSTLQCADGLDNDKDSLIDSKDSHCDDANDNDESSSLAYREAGGQVVIEAEKYHSKIAGSNLAPRTHTWERNDGPPAENVAVYSGNGYMVVWPDIIPANSTEQDNPKLSYKVNFTTTGRYHVWVRGSGKDGLSDSVHMSLDNQPLSTADNIVNDGVWSKNQGFSWTKKIKDVDSSFAYLDVSVGEHTIQVQMREDGFRFDKIILTTNSAFVPSGTDPAESPRN